ncbi:MAG: alpha/beta fold hydrolase [Planctomycetes bacterium]|nr:alpha/beta fold hydrolase [Planctomycetota bacterium]
MEWVWLSLGIIVLLVVLAPLALHWHVVHNYIPVVLRIFQEKPIFIMPFGKPTPDAEEVTLTTPDGLALRGIYLRTSKPRKGVILFGLEFGSNRWACLPYCEFLRDAGYDIFTFEMRGQGESPTQPSYEPLQWVTDFEVIDFQTALLYLKGRPDRDPRGIGFFGLSKGGSAGLMVAAQDDFVRCCVVDGAFACLTTMVPYMAQWVLIYTSMPWLARIIPYWYLAIAAQIAIRQIEKLRDCHYPLLESALPNLAPRPLLMIHGSADNYIKPEMARTLFGLAGDPKELWMVENAKHNQAIHLAGEEYKKKVLAFFEQHLANGSVLATPGSTDAARPLNEPSAI